VNIKWVEIPFSEFEKIDLEGLLVTFSGLVEEFPGLHFMEFGRFSGRGSDYRIHTIEQVTSDGVQEIRVCHTRYFKRG